MMWVRLDCTLATHRKFLRAGPEASWMWVCGLAYANQHTTDGAIPREALTALYPSDDWSPTKRRTLASRLVEVGLWETNPDGSWSIHGYSEHQGEAMSEAVDARRERERDKKRAQREREKQSVSHRVSPGDTSGSPLSMSPPATRRVPGVSPPSDRPTVRPSDAGAEEEKTLSLAPPPASPTPVQPTLPDLDGGATKGDDNGKPTKPTKAKRPRTSKRNDAPPFAPADALAAIARGAGDRFAPGVESEWAKGHVIALCKSIRQFPDLEVWHLVGEWLAAGGERYRGTVGPSWAASSALANAVTLARQWAERGRGPVDARPVALVAAEPLNDPWVAAAAKSGVRL